MKKRNAAFVGGGVSTVCGLGAYYAEVQLGEEFDSFSGASIGSVAAIGLAAGKDPFEIMQFLRKNIKDFCRPIIGKKFIRERTNEFLGGMRYADLSFMCTVSVTKIGEKTPTLITRINCDDMTVGEVAAMSSTLPGLYFPSYMHFMGRNFWVLDGGMTANPPIIEGAENVVNTFKRVLKKPSNSVWAKRKALQERKADRVVKISTVTSTRGDRRDITAAWIEGISQVEQGSI